MITFLLDGAAIVGVYMYLVGLGGIELTYGVMITYIAVFLLLVFGYVVYNRGIFRQVTPDMIKPEISYEERVSIAEDINKRQDKSFWMIPTAIPFLLSFLLDYIGIQEIFQNIWGLF